MTLRRAILLAVSCLLGGFATNVVVAWACTLHPPGGLVLDTADEIRISVDQFMVTVNVAQSPTTNYVWCQFVPPGEEDEWEQSLPVSDETGLDAVMPRWAQGHARYILRQGIRDRMRVTERGWPSPSMGGTHSTLTGFRHTWDTRPIGQSKFLPLRPVWPSTIWNTLFYAGILLGLHQLLTLWTRSLRKRRGLCPRCRYDLRGAGQPGCSECGWQLKTPGPQI